MRSQVADRSNEEEWYLDSGCTMHLSGKAELLKKEMKACNEYVILADGRTLQAKAIGTATLNITGENGEWRTIRVENVLFVPTLSSNLLSVGRIAEQGFKVSFEAEKCLIMKGSRVIAAGIRKNGMYALV